MKDVLKMIGLIAIGIVIGMSLSWIFIIVGVSSFVNSFMPNINIDNVQFELNETALIEAINKTILLGDEVKDD